jgi:predicted dinucleotide-binding enzyme
MRIGIIGAGNIGETLTRRLRALGHEVSVANSRGPETLAGLARETGAKPVTVKEAARAGRACLIPQRAESDLRWVSGSDLQSDSQGEVVRS